MSVTLLGLPFDEDSSWLRGCAAGPDAIRTALRCPSSNASLENERDVFADIGLADAGNLQASSSEEARAVIEESVGQLLENSQKVLSLGGDHSVTFPILAAYGRRSPDLTVLHLDAHSDLYDELDGNRHSHACPFTRAFEAGAIKRLIQVGIRTMNAAQRVNADRFGVEIITAAEFAAGRRYTDLRPLEGPVYLSLDLDVLDPAFAPGISHYEPGGLTTREVLQIIHSLDCDLVGADVVELNPARDCHDMTAMVAAKFVKEIVGAF